MPPFSKVLIANRGEIVVRVAQTARAHGYRTVAVYSDADAASPHVIACDEAVHIGAAAAAESYLSIERVIDAARRSGVDAVHPGYGFLSENADFAAACTDAGLSFIGPSAASIRAMGNKATAKQRMIAAGVPCIPGYDGPQGFDAFALAAKTIGYPVMLKAAAGGGGKGMRVVASERDLAAAYEATAHEAQRAFGSGELLLEKALVGPRHIEIQILADAHGTTMHLGERDCSIQRRHQKIIEETPSTAVSAELREAMGAAAIAAAKAVDYTGAGTIEFLLDRNGQFYFLEMNTRLQVEHAITEAVYGIDLVAWQLRVAAGERLDLAKRGPLEPHGHAIEARLYAEDPAADFLPQAGRIVTWQKPHGAGIRVDDALRDGLEVTPYYDPMIAKIVASGRDREEARRRLVMALEATTILGITTNRSFLIACLENAVFVAGDARTDFIAEARPAHASEPSGETIALAAVLHATRTARDTSWQSRGSSSLNLKLRVGDVAKNVLVRRFGSEVNATVGDRTYAIAIAVADRATGAVRFTIDGVTRAAHAAFDGTTLYLQTARETLAATDVSFASAATAAAGASGNATSPMPGIVAKISVEIGDEVVLGQTLVVLEAMKMLHEISAGTTGRVANILVAPGQQVGMRALLVEIDASEART